jgi:hypothetical protein
VGTPFLKVKIRVLQRLLVLLAVLVQQVVCLLVAWLVSMHLSWVRWLNLQSLP